MRGQPANGRAVSGRSRTAALLAPLLLTLSLNLFQTPAKAAPSHQDVPPAPHLIQAGPGWLSAESAARLDLGFSVLIPAAVPGPFVGEPSIYAASGYYSLYWVIYGGEPTFLEVRGEVGGDIPDGSAYDLNVPLAVNADVQGNAAYRDLTPIYDTVWWESGGVVYMVSSRGLGGTDSLSIANALTRLIPPASVEPPPSTGGGGSGQPSNPDPGNSSGGAPGGGNGATSPAPAPNPIVVAPEVVVSGEATTIAVEGISGATLQADAGVFPETGTRSYPDAGGFAVQWEAPVVETDQTLGFVLVDPANGEWLATASTQVLASGATGVDPDPDGVAGTNLPAPDTEEGDGTGSPAPGPVSPGMTTSNLTGDIAMSCPTVAYSGRLMPIKIEGAIPAIVNSTLGGWPDEPGNRAFDPEVDGGPALIGSVERDESLFIHWRAPTVTGATEGRFFLTHPDGTALAECTVTIQPGEPPARRPLPTLDDRLEHDGTGGPFPFREAGNDSSTADDAAEILGPMPAAAPGDGSQGPMIPSSDGSGGVPLPTPEGDGSQGPDA
jgi:hypothetical protein